MALAPDEVGHGPMFLGLCFNILLLGIMMTQVYMYMTTYKRDRYYIKIFVAFLLAADILNTGFMIAYMYKALILYFGEPMTMGNTNWIFATDPAMTSIIGSMVQTFYAWRIYALTRSKWIAGLVFCCALTTLFGGLTTAVELRFVAQFPLFANLTIPLCFWIIPGVVGDVIIMVTLVLFLRNHRTGFSATDSRVDKIIRLIIQTGMATCLNSLAHLILYLAYPTELHLLFNLMQAKLYSNSLMSTLNARGGWGQRDGGAASGHGPDTGLPLEVSVHVSHIASGNGFGSPATPGFPVQVHTPQSAYGPGRIAFAPSSPTSPGFATLHEKDKESRERHSENSNSERDGDDKTDSDIVITTLPAQPPASRYGPPDSWLAL